jgi:hypothetical protein
MLSSLAFFCKSDNRKVRILVGKTLQVPGKVVALLKVNLQQATFALSQSL